MLLYAFVCACGFLRLHSLGMYVCTYIHIYVDACTCCRVVRATTTYNVMYG